MTSQQIHIVDEVEPTDSQQRESETAEIEAPVRDAAISPFEEADPIDTQVGIEINRSADSREQRRRTRFVRAVADELGKADDVRDARILDRLDPEATDDVDFGALLAFPDDAVMFVGSDPTAKDAVPLFAFCVERHQPIPAPTSAQEALGLLRPGVIRQAFDEGETPDRQGEWWLLPTRKVPIGTTFEPGVSSRPFGPSPLGNHVPREYGFAVSDDDFMAGVRDEVDELPPSVSTPPEAIRWIHRQRQKVPTPDYAPEWGTIREIADEIFVRGTLRHRENDHYVEDLGQQWHEALTHDMDVYTGDDMINEVRLD